MKSVLIGKIVNIHGIKGEVKIMPYTDDIENLSKLKKIYLDKNLDICYNITSNRVHKNMLIVKLEGIDDANIALTFKTKDVFIPRNSLKELEEGTYYIEDLIGCLVIDLDKNSVLGKLVYVYNTGANDVYEIEKEDGTKVYLPAISQVIKKVDIKEKKIYAQLMEGLL